MREHAKTAMGTWAGHMEIQSAATRGGIKHVYRHLDSHVAILSRCKQTRAAAAPRGQHWPLARGQGHEEADIAETRDVNGAEAHHFLDVFSFCEEVLCVFFKRGEGAPRGDEE